MENTIILKEGAAILTASELKSFRKGDTIFGDNSLPIEIARWDISQKDEAEKALAQYRCKYDGGRISEFALEYCETDGDGEWISGSDFDFAPEESEEE